MIYLLTEAINQVIVTLQEKTTLDAPVYYLFVFSNPDTREEVIFTAADMSTNPCRYNKFLVEVNNTTPDPLDGKVDMDPLGYWDYVIYEQESETNLIVANTTGIVETGKVYLKGDVVPERTSYTPDSNIRKAYQG